MSALLGLSRAIDAFNQRIGRTVCWLLVAAILVSAINAIVRKLFNVSSNSWLELQWVMFGAVFLCCAPWTLAVDEHIRIDIVNARLPRTVRNWIEIVGHTLFLIPIAAVMVWLSWPFLLASMPTGAALTSAFVGLIGSPFTFSPASIGRAWTNFMALGEQSTNAGGLPVWPAKALVPIGFALLLAQGISELIKRVAIMQGLLDDRGAAGGHLAAAEAEAARIRHELEAEVARRQGDRRQGDGRQGDNGR